MDQASNPSWPTFSRSRTKTRTRAGRGCTWRSREPNKRMRDKAALACRALCRARVTEELQRRRGTRIAEHLKLVLSVIDRPEP
jgi:hypothetical protein